MVQKGIKCTVLAGKIAIEGLAGDSQVLAKVADRDIVIAPFAHQSEKTVFNVALSL
jgi:hypothetical protein